MIPRWAYAAAGGLFVAGAGVIGALGFAYGALENTAPEQPLAFSHKLHAGEYEIRCLFCHRAATVSRTAGIPSMETCVQCHTYIGTEKEGVVELLRAWEEKKPIAWVRVHDLADFVYFPHTAHVAAGVGCQTCHGPVEPMERITRVASLSMGWCLGCHNKNRAGVDCWTCHI